MVMFLSRKGFGAALLVAASAAFLGSASAARAGDIDVSTPWTRATVRGASVGVGYMTIENKGKEADRLTGAVTDAAAKVEVHEMKMDGAIMRMRFLPDGLEIKPGVTVTLKPGSYHLMLMGLKKPLLPGDSVHVTLNFAKAGPIAVDMPVEGFGATKPPAQPAPAATTTPNY